MYNKKRALSLLAILILHLIIISVSASGHATPPVETNGIQNGFHFRLLGNTDVSRAALTSFDVAPDGRVVIGLDNYTLLLMDSNGTTTQSIQFDGDGEYYVRWSNDNVLLYFARGDIAVEITKNGIVQAINKMDANVTWTTFERNRVSLENGDTYIADNQNTALSFLSCGRYARLTKTDSDNNAIVLYDVSEALSAKIITWVIIIGIFVIGVVGSILFAPYFYKRQNEST